LNQKDTTVEAGLYTIIPHNANDKNDPREDIIFGTMYRNWGHFGWNGNRDWAEQRIEKTLLKISDAAKDPKRTETEGVTGENLEGSGETYDATKDRFLPLIA